MGKRKPHGLLAVGAAVGAFAVGVAAGSRARGGLTCLFEDLTIAQGKLLNALDETCADYSAAFRATARWAAWLEDESEFPAWATGKVMPRQAVWGTDAVPPFDWGGWSDGEALAGDCRAAIGKLFAGAGEKA